MVVVEAGTAVITGCGESKWACVGQTGYCIRIFVACAKDNGDNCDTPQRYKLLLLRFGWNIMETTVKNRRYSSNKDWETTHNWVKVVDVRKLSERRFTSSHWKESDVKWHTTRDISHKKRSVNQWMHSHQNQKTVVMNYFSVYARVLKRIRTWKNRGHEQAHVSNLPVQSAVQFTAVNCTSNNYRDAWEQAHYWNIQSNKLYQVMLNSPDQFPTEYIMCLLLNPQESKTFVVTSIEYSHFCYFTKL